MSAIAHDLEEETLVPLDLSETKTLIKEEQTLDWQRFYEGERDSLHIGYIKESSTTWSWLPHRHRRVDIAMTRLRIGHVGLNEYLTKFNMAHDENCSHCNVPESVQHFLIYCGKYQDIRGKLRTSLRQLGVTSFTVKILLGGGDFTKDTQKQIMDVVGKFLLETGVIDNL